MRCRALGLAVALCAVALCVAACAPTAPAPDPATAAPTMLMYPSGRGSLITRDGVDLPLRRWQPDGEPWAILLALHGFNDYSNAFSLPAERFAQAGILTYAYDQRGFGLGPNPGRWAGLDRLAGDVRDALRLIAARHPSKPVFLLGESMGAAIALVALAGDRRAGETGDPRAPLPPPLPPPTPPIAGLILSAPAVWNRASMPALYRRILTAANGVMPWYPLTGEGLRIQATDNIPVLIELGRDPFVIKRTRVDSIAGMVDLMDAAVAAAPHVRTPTLLLYGLKDQVIPPKPTFTVAEAAQAPNAPQNAPWRLAVYDGGYHLLLRDLAGARVAADVAAWIADGRAPLPSGADRQALPRLKARATGEPLAEAATAGSETFAPDAALR